MIKKTLSSLEKEIQEKKIQLARRGVDLRVKYEDGSFAGFSVVEAFDRFGYVRDGVDIEKIREQDQTLIVLKSTEVS